MFELTQPEPRYRRWSRGAFLVLTPLIFVVVLLRSRPAIIHVSFDPFWIGNYSPSGLPGVLAEIFSYGYYLATAAALLLASVCAVVLHPSRRERATVGPGIVWYLPAFVAGIEAMRHASLLGSRHSFTAMPTLVDIRTEWLLASTASVLLVLVCVTMGCVFAKVARDNWSIPFTIVPVVLSILAGWFAQLSLLWLVF